MFDLSRYALVDVQRTHDERQDHMVGVETFVFKPYKKDFLVNRIGVSFCPPWMYMHCRVGEILVLVCPLFLAQRGRLNIEVPGDQWVFVEVLPGHAHTYKMAESYGEKIMINRFEAVMTIREAIR